MRSVMMILQELSASKTNISNATNDRTIPSCLSGSRKDNARLTKKVRFAKQGLPLLLFTKIDVFRNGKEKSQGHNTSNVNTDTQTSSTTF